MLIMYANAARLTDMGRHIR